MADRYWVGSTGSWSQTAHWSATSGGEGGADVPTSSDDVFIDENSGFGGGGTITLDGSGECNNFTSSSGHSYTFITDNEDYSLNIYGSSTFESGIMFDVEEEDFFVTFKATGIGKTITNGGVSFWSIRFDGIGGEWKLQDNLICDNNIYHNNGTFDANDHNITASTYISEEGTAVLNMGSGTWIILGDWLIRNSDDLTLSAETSTLKIGGASNSMVGFEGGGKSYNIIWLYDTSDYITIFDSSTFSELKISSGKTIYFTTGTTQIVSAFTAVGTIGNLIVLDMVPLGAVQSGHISEAGTGYSVDEEVILEYGNSDCILTVTSIDGSGGITGVTIKEGGSRYEVIGGINIIGGNNDAYYDVDSIDSGDQFTLSKSSGIVECDYLNISNSIATGGADWYAGDNSNDTINNDGWIFTAPPSAVVQDVIQPGIVVFPR